MKVLGICGWSGSGKTTLVEKLLPLLAAAGTRVSTIKRSHHGFDVDTPGKDSWRHRQAGAHEVMVASDLRWALLREQRSAAPASLADLLARMEPVDLVLVEGFTAEPHAKIEVWRAAAGKPLRAQDDPFLLAVACPRAEFAAAASAPARLDLDQPGDVAAFVLRWLGC